MTTRRPWHIPLPAIPIPPTTKPATHPELAALVTAASERHIRRQHGDAR